MARWTLILCAALLLGMAVGCASSISTQGKSPLSSPGLAADSVALEVTTLRFPLNDPEINGPLWNEIDEQQWPVEVRKQLSANGLRIGMLGSRLPTRLEEMLKAEKPSAPASSEVKLVDFNSESTAKGRFLQMRAGRPTHFVCTGEQVRHPELSILMRGDNGEVRGQTYSKVMGFLALRAFPEGDGRVKIELVPSIEHGDPQRQYDPSEGMLRMEIRPNQEKYDSLRTESKLSSGQMLVVTAIPDRLGSLGYHFFTERNADRTMQKLVLIRLAQSQYDELFSLEELPKSEE